MDANINEREAALIESFAEVQDGGFFPCPRCGRRTMSDRVTRNALSRYASIYICDECGTDEAIRAFAGQPLPLSEWSIALQPEVYLR